MTEPVCEMKKGVFYTTPEIYEHFRKEYAELFQYFVYVHTSPEGKRYVGYGKGKPNDRWERGYGYRNNRRFWEDIVKFGWDCFQHDIVDDGLCLEEARRLERETVISLESWKKEKGYNSFIPKSHEDEEHYSVYQLIFPDNKMYVGKSGVPLEKRWDSGYGYRRMPELFAAIQACGWENVIKIRCMENILEESASAMEQYLIAVNHTTDPAHGYNKSIGGKTESGWHPAEESRRKAAAANLGRKKTPEEIRRLKKAMEHLRKPVRNTSTGEVYPSQADAAKALGVTEAAINAHLRGKLKTVKGTVLERIERR